MQGWHQNVAVRSRDVRWIGNQTAGWLLLDSLEETAVVHLQDYTNQT